MVAQIVAGELMTMKTAKTAILLISAATLLGCKDLTGKQELPSGIQNPSAFSTPAGAVGMRVAAIEALQDAIPPYIVNSGALTDEIKLCDSVGCSTPLVGNGGLLDERVLNELGYGENGTAADQNYGALQHARGMIAQAIGAVAAYDTGAAKQGDPVAMRSELYALEGYIEILLADFFCSGVPLSTLDFQGDFSYRPGATTAQVYQDAISKLDTALQLATVSHNTQLRDLALVLKGRTWINLGQYDSANAAVTGIPEEFQYRLAIPWRRGNEPNDWIFGMGYRLSDREGMNGLPFVSSGDPRTRDSVTSIGGEGDAELSTTRYSEIDRFSPFIVADAIEARLIQSEVALKNGNTAAWLTLLNQLRKTAAVPGQTVIPIDTLVDPGSDTARVSLTFQERAYWLYLTGHRQGDLRRLIRQYNRRQDQVYPTGPYFVPGAGSRYGSEVTAPIPGAEYANPLFHGCRSRGA